MAYQTTWYQSMIPTSMVDFIERDLTSDSSVPESHWVGGLVWHYILRANRENFLYDLSQLDNSSVKYKVYNEGDSQGWHNDADVIDGPGDVRKLSFTLQLSNYNDYEGGNVQFIDEGGGKYFIPRNRGCIALFDSRTQHRVHKVTKGTRKALVGWCVGPQWR